MCFWPVVVAPMTPPPRLQAQLYLHYIGTPLRDIIILVRQSPYPCHTTYSLFSIIHQPVSRVSILL